MRLAQLLIAFAAVMALIVGSAMVPREQYVPFASLVIAAAGALIWVVYRELARRWILKTYALLLDCRLGEAKARVEAQRSALSSAIKRPLLDLLWGELLFWAGEHERAYEAAKQLDALRLPELWRGSAYELELVCAAFTGRVTHARAVLTAQAAVLRERPGFHELEALVALREGDPKKARERWQSAADSRPRPPLVRAALALLQAEIALGHGESPDVFVAEAISFGGESFVTQQARALRPHH